MKIVLLMHKFLNNQDKADQYSGKMKYIIETERATPPATRTRALLK